MQMAAVLAANHDGSVVSIANRNSRSLHLDKNQQPSEMRLTRTEYDAREICSVENNAATQTKSVMGPTML